MSLICLLPVGIGAFEDGKQGGIGFLLCGSSALVTLGELSRFFRRAHCDGWRWGNKRPEVLSEFLDVDVEVILGLGIEMSSFSVGVGGLGNGGAEVSFLLLLLSSGVVRWRDGF